MTLIELMIEFFVVSCNFFRILNLLHGNFPPKWQIVATANPEGGDYSVTPIDDAMLTRMIHATLDFDPKDWALWADSADVDKKRISFVLSHRKLLLSNELLLEH